MKRIKRMGREFIRYIDSLRSLHVGYVSVSNIGLVFRLSAIGGSAFGRNTINEKRITTNDTYP